MKCWIYTQSSQFQKDIDNGIITELNNVSLTYSNYCHYADSPSSVREKYPYDGQVPEETYASQANLIFSWISSILSIGGMIGALFSAPLLVDKLKFDRKMCLIIIYLIFMISAMFSALATDYQIFNSWEVLLVSRIFSGLAAGSATAISTNYLAELGHLNSQNSKDGAVGGLYGYSFNLFVVTGSSASQVMGHHYVLGTATLWYLIFWTQCAVAFIGLLLIFFSYETYFPENKSEVVQDTEVTNSPSLMIKLKNIKNDPLQIGNQTTLSILLVGIHLMMCQQFNGINSFMFYSNIVLKATGLNRNEIDIWVIFLSIGLILGTILGVAFSRHKGHLNYLGYRPLMLNTMIFLAICNFIFTIFTIYSEKATILAYIQIGWIFLFEIAFAVGPGAIPWFYIPYFMPENNPNREFMQSIACFVNWLSMFVVTLLFPILDQAMGAYVFIIFGVFCVYAAVVIFLRMGEFKNLAQPQRLIQSD